MRIKIIWIWIEIFWIPVVEIWMLTFLWLYFLSLVNLTNDNKVTDTVVVMSTTVPAYVSHSQASSSMKAPKVLKHNHEPIGSAIVQLNRIELNGLIRVVHHVA